MRCIDAVKRKVIPIVDRGGRAIVNDRPIVFHVPVEWPKQSLPYPGGDFVFPVLPGFFQVPLAIVKWEWLRLAEQGLSDCIFPAIRLIAGWLFPGAFDIGHRWYGVGWFFLLVVPIGLKAVLSAGWLFPVPESPFLLTLANNVRFHRPFDLAEAGPVSGWKTKSLQSVFSKPLRLLFRFGGRIPGFSDSPRIQLPIEAIVFHFLPIAAF